MTVVWKTERIWVGLKNESSETPFTTTDGYGMAWLDGTRWAADFSTEYTFYKKRSATVINHLQTPDHFSDQV